jgi:hypothetical protein
MSSEHTYAIGDRVIIDPAVAAARHRGIVDRVTRLLPVNVVVEPEGGGRTMRINPSFYSPRPTPTTASPAPAPTRAPRWPASS